MYLQGRLLTLPTRGTPERTTHARMCLVGAQQQDQAREAASAGRTACGAALGRLRYGCCRPYLLGRRTTRKNDGRRRRGRSADRHVSAPPARPPVKLARCSGTNRDDPDLSGDGYPPLQFGQSGYRVGDEDRVAP